MHLSDSARATRCIFVQGRYTPKPATTLGAPDPALRSAGLLPGEHVVFDIWEASCRHLMSIPTRQAPPRGRILTGLVRHQDLTRADFSERVSSPKRTSIARPVAGLFACLICLVDWDVEPLHDHLNGSASA